MIQNPSNWINHRCITEGPLSEVLSPVTNKCIVEVPVASEEMIRQALAHMSAENDIPALPNILAFLSRLRERFIKHRALLIDLHSLETGYNEHDNAEMIDALIEYLADFEVSMNDGCHGAPGLIKQSYSEDTGRYMRLIKRPYRCVAVMVPQNASLTLAVIAIASALSVGAKVIVRPSLQCGATGAVLSQLLEESDAPAGMISVVNAKAKDFLAACYDSMFVDLIHYIGSDQYARPVLSESFRHGKVPLIDGEGNGLLYVDRDYPIDQAVKIIVEGATRYNGETCTSVNGVLVHQSRFDELKTALVDAFTQLKVGNPREEDAQIGPLFSAEQANAMLARINENENTQILCGGKVEGAYFSPTIITNVSQTDAVVSEGFFAPAVWLKGVEDQEIWQWMATNRFPLSDTILSHNQNHIDRFIRQSRAARVCINEDPSIESMFEPWGGYPPGGLNSVSVWAEKYQQTIQLDGSLDSVQACQLST